MQRIFFSNLPANRLASFQTIRRFHRSAIWEVRKEFKLADIGEGITECEIIKWNVKPSAHVKAFDPLCEVQSDKASVEITSPFDGVVGELLVEEGQVAKVGQNLCFIEVEDEEGASADEPENAHENNSSEDTSVGGLEERNTPSEAEVSKKDREFGEDVASGVSRPLGTELHPMDPRMVEKQSTRMADGNNILALPSVRHLAKQMGVNLNMIAPGSGKHGRIEKRDVEAYAGRANEKPSPAQYRIGNSKPYGEDVVVELGRTRYAMWKAMTKSLEIPQFGYSSYMDLTNIHNILPTLTINIPRHLLLNPPPERPLIVNPAALYPTPVPSSGDVPETAKINRVTYLPFLLKTLSIAMNEWPLFRSSISPPLIKDGQETDGKPTLTIRPQADISIALSTPTGLYTPTLQDVCSHSVYSLASALAHLSALGRRTPSGLGPAEMPRAGGTITISNVGAIGRGEFASPVLVPGGGVAIGAVGRAKWVWDEERQEKRYVVGVSWSADHRVVEGAELAAFVECWRGYVEQPERLIGMGA